MPWWTGQRKKFHEGHISYERSTEWIIIVYVRGVLRKISASHVTQDYFLGLRVYPVPILWTPPILVSSSTDLDLYRYEVFIKESKIDGNTKPFVSTLTLKYSLFLQLRHQSVCVEIIYPSNFVSLHSSIYLNTPLGFMRICCAKFENWSNYGANKSQHFSSINHVKM